MTALEINELPNNEFYGNTFTTKIGNEIMKVAGISDHTVNLVHREELTKVSVEGCTLNFTMTPNK